MFAFAASALLFVGCNLTPTENPAPDNTTKPFVKSDLQKLYEKSFNGKSVAIKGDTTIKENIIKLHEPPSSVNIKNLINRNGSFKMISVGGGLTAGAREGGLHRNGQLTSFPNLMSIQMKADFAQPIFGENEFNGFGFKVLSSMSNGVPKYNTVSNNLALLKTDPVIELNPYKGEFNNWGVPFAGRNDLRFDRDLVPVSYLNLSNPYKSRILPNITEQGNNNIEYKILNQRYDFVIIESGLDNYIYSLLTGGRSKFTGSPNFRPDPYVTIMEYTNSIGAKSIIANMPDITDFPFINYILPKDIRKINQAELYVKSGSSVISVQDGCFLLPNSLTDSLMSPKIESNKKRGLAFNNPLEADEVYTLDELSGLKNQLETDNKAILLYANYYKVPVVDLYTLFKKVSSEIFVTDDGIRVNKANFFSSDGIFPSAFGQAIIANEYIKIINEYYKTDISLIKTAYYLNK